MFYLLNFLIIPIYYIFIKTITKKQHDSIRLFALIVLIHAVLIRALANPFNYVDTERYAEAYKYISELNISEAIFSFNYYSAWGQGYVAINWILAQFNTDPQFLFILISFISVAGIILFYYKTSYTFLTSVLLYLIYPMMYISGFGVLRQHLAVVFVLWSLYYMDNLKKSVPIAIFGSLCHMSGFLIFPFFFIRNLDLLKFNIRKLVIGSILGVILIRIAVQYAISLLPRYQAVVELDEGHNNIVPVLLIGSSIFLLLYTGVYKIASPRERYYILFMIYGFALSLFSIGFPGAGRLTLFHIYTLPVVVSLLYKYSPSRYKHFFYCYVFFLFSITVLQLYIASFSENWKYGKYLFLWQSI